MATISMESTGKAAMAQFFNDVSLGFSELELRFRLIHLWEARNTAKGAWSRRLHQIELMWVCSDSRIAVEKKKKKKKKKATGDAEILHHFHYCRKASPEM
ncbi:hypothetical protein DY000_02061262 [Brassica cretica]|uniref:Uncharacterized protein n=1 Tax=Brassica cretica TaxID=69181 RepID=A0ABQ7ANW4_BRACR|nr:hypothetical protein DY000_02061262 [Brassica cretica]